MRPALVVGLWLCLSLAVRAQLPEQAPPVELTWTAPPDCDGAAEVQARVRELLGSTEVAASPLRASANVERRDDGQLQLRLRIEAAGRVGEREITSKSCGDLVGATAVALALLVRDAERIAQEPAAESADPSAKPTEDDAEPSAVVVDGAMPAKTRAAYAVLQVPNALLGLGLLPQPSFGFSLAAGARFGPWELLAEGLAWLPQRISTSYQGERPGADVQRFAAGVRACHAFSWPRWQLAPCLVVSAEHLSARGTGTHVAPATAKATWGAVGAGAQARFSVVRWLRLIGGVDVLFQTSQPTITIEEVGTVARLAPAAVVLKLGLEWIL